MVTKTKYWEITCEKHMEILFQRKINVSHISEQNLNQFIRTLISKYALTDEEILELYTNKPFTKKKDYINITRTNSNLNESLEINFIAQIADISVIVQLKSEK